MEEYLDIIDERGNPTGKEKLKSEVHRDGDRHKTVHVWILNSRGELLIQRRSIVKQNQPNMWDISYAGHISAGENSIDAAIREGEEELSLEIKKEQLRYLFTIKNVPMELNNGAYIDYELQDVYLLRLINKNPIFRLQSEEVTEVKWVSWKTLKQIIKSGDAMFVEHAQEYEKLFIFLGGHQ
jgi:isopentenyl-diphosphate delta-isomerase